MTNPAKDKSPRLLCTIFTRRWLAEATANSRHQVDETAPAGQIRRGSTKVAQKGMASAAMMAVYTEMRGWCHAGGHGRAS